MPDDIRVEIDESAPQRIYARGRSRSALSEALGQSASPSLDGPAVPLPIPSPPPRPTWSSAIAQSAPVSAPLPPTPNGRHPFTSIATSPFMHRQDSRAGTSHESTDHLVGSFHSGYTLLNYHGSSELRHRQAPRRDSHDGGRAKHDSQDGDPPGQLSVPLLHHHGPATHPEAEEQEPSMGGDGALLPVYEVEEGEHRRASFANNIVFGIINAVVGIPSMISFAAIVFQDPLYRPYLAHLAQFSFLAAALHAAVFTLLSSLPFAVGQPQDVGLIFLSAMTTSIAQLGTTAVRPMAEIIGTSLLTMTMATFVVGCLTVVIGRLKLATLVQYLPLPVVGGYLAYVGYFCLAAGLSLGTDTHINDFSTWLQLFHRDALIKLVPTAASTIALLGTMKYSKSPWSLPVALAVIPATFYGYLLATGVSLADAQATGWVFKPEQEGLVYFWELYGMFNIQDWRLSGIYWPAVARQLPKVVALFFVVAFGTSLDVAAIQADVPDPIDFNNELKTAGFSNIVVGLSGSGYTGSYIFSQTIFSMRAGVNSRVHGCIIAGLELLFFLLPISVVQYLPNFFFGSLLTVFGVEILTDWIVHSYRKVTQAEYTLLLLTYLAIMQLGLELGILVGIALSTAYFAYSYAQVNVTASAVVASASGAVRSFEERALLERFQDRMVAVALEGYVFFGSSVRISNRVVQLAELMIQQQERQQQDDAATADAVATSSSTPSSPVKVPPAPNTTAAAVNGTVATAAATATAKPPTGVAKPVHDGKQAPAADNSNNSLLQPQQLATAFAAAPYFVLLDFTRVAGLDATSAQQFSTLRNTLGRLGVELVLTHVAKPQMRRLLLAHGMISPHASQQQQEPQESLPRGCCQALPSIDDGARYCEDRFLSLARKYGLLQSQAHSMTMVDFVKGHLPQRSRPAAAAVASPSLAAAAPAAAPPAGAAAPAGTAASAPNAARTARTAASDAAAADEAEHAAAELTRFGHLRRTVAGEVLFSYDETPVEMFFILQGEVCSEVRPATGGPLERHVSIPADLLQSARPRRFHFGPGGIVGSTDLVLDRPRSFRATCATACHVLALPAAALQRMAQTAPRTLNILQAILLQDACRQELQHVQVPSTT